MSALKYLWGIVAVVALLLGSVALGAVDAAPAFVWTVPMVADAGGEGSSSNLEFGIDTAATNGFDSGIDVPHPPPAPTPPPFDAYFSITDMLFPSLYKDFRGAVPNSWTLVVRSTSNTISLCWNTTGVPSGVGLSLTEGALNIDMKAQNCTTLAAGSHTLTIAATVVVPTYALTMAADPVGGGTATDQTNTGPYEEDELVSIKAQAAAGYRFVNWTAPAGSFANANAAETTFTMPGQAVTVTANFELIPTYALTMAVTPVGSGTATDQTNTGPYEEDELVSIKAQAAAGYRFVNWTAPAGSFANANAAETTFTMPAQAVTVTAHFEQVPTYALTMAVTPVGSGTATDQTDTGPYEQGEQVSIKAQAVAGYRFVNWTAPAGSFANANAAETTFTMPAQAVTVTAHFELIPTYALTMAVTPLGSGTATDQTNTGPYEQGEQVSIRAQAAAGYRFVKWTASAGSLANANAAETTFTMPAQAVTVTAHFVAFTAPGNVDLVRADLGVESITVSTIDLGAVNTTDMPEGIEPQEAYVVDSTGTGSFTLRFTDIANASSIVIYKVVDSAWTQISPTAITVIGPTTIDITMEVGDPILVFASRMGAVGGDAFPTNKLLLLIPWIVLGAGLVTATSLLVLRRRRA